MELTRHGQPRVVITGIAGLTPLGKPAQFWENLKNGVSGIKRADHLDLSTIDVHIAGMVQDFDPSPYIEKKEIRRLPLCTQFSIATTHMLLEDSGLTPDDLARDALVSGVVIGTGMGGFESLEEGVAAYKEGHRPKPFAIAAGLTNAQAFYVSRETGALGPLKTISAACASGTHALVDALDLIRLGRAERVFVGGVESTTKEYTLAGFDSMTGLATGYNDAPEKACRPFDKNRNGFVFSEGSALFVVETLERALARNAKIYAEVLGGASSADAFHLAAIEPEGRGAINSMRWALEDAKVNPDDIDYINAHGTGTPHNDKIETYAIKQVFGEQAYNIPISSTKSMIGHLMGAAGAVEALACIMTLNDQVIHPTINYETPDEECDLDYVPNVARDAEVNYILSSNFGLGGQNASVVLGKI